MTTAIQTYPVRVEGRLDPGLSRWLWLIKWLLVIPHYVVLVFLWAAFTVFSVIAFFAILFSGRYPRAIFDFNVGVLRWSWRVGFYAFAANGTDRYPPFTLAATDYPATFDVEYPQRLSRGLVLVKWWLLALPHYLIVAVFAGGAVWGWHSSAGLIDVLVLIAAIALLFSGRYPREIFDLVVGLNRWALRVAAYAALMTDRYPPFRLDLGDSEPGALTISRPGNESAAPTPLGGGAVTEARAAPLVAGSLAAALAVLLLLAGGGLLVFDRTQRDVSGFLMRGANTFSTNTYAIVSDQIRPNRNGFDWGTGSGSTIQIRTTSTKPVFVGVGPARAVERYLARTAHESVPDLGTVHGTTVAGNAAPPAPQAQTFWVARSSGVGHQELRWSMRDGTWRAVVMNANGASGVTADVSVGMRLPHLVEIALGGLAAGAVLLATGLALMYAGMRRPRTS